MTPKSHHKIDEGEEERQVAEDFERAATCQECDDVTLWRKEERHKGVRLCAVVEPETGRLATEGHLCFEHRALYLDGGFEISFPRTREKRRGCPVARNVYWLKRRMFCPKDWADIVLLFGLTAALGTDAVEEIPVLLATLEEVSG